MSLSDIQDVAGMIQHTAPSSSGMSQPANIIDVQADGSLLAAQWSGNAQSDELGLNVPNSPHGEDCLVLRSRSVCQSLGYSDRLFSCHWQWQEPLMEQR